MGDMQSTKSRMDQTDEIDLGELFEMLWSGKWLILATGVGFTAVAVVVALILPNVYRADALLAPAEQSGGGMSAMMQQYGGLASLAGVSLPGGEDASRAQIGMALLTSRDFIGGFVERRQILPELMAAQSWDMVSQELLFDHNIYNPESRAWVREVNPPLRSKPSLLEAHERFMEILTVSQDKQTGFVTISVEHLVPEIAASWVTWLVSDVNEAVRSQDVSEANKSITYLRQQVQNTSLADLQAVFFDLIQSQMETVMLAEVRAEYVFTTLDPAVAPERKSGPPRILISLFGMLLGGVLGSILVVVRKHR